MKRRSQIIIFPWARCLAEIRRAAHELDTSPTRRIQRARWNATVQRIEKTLRRLGAAEAEIADQVEQFGIAVSSELCRRAS